MAITWKLHDVNVGANGSVCVSVREVIDGVDGEVFHSALLHHSYGMQVVLDDLKRKIIAYRADRKVEEEIRKGFDVDTFEDFLNV